LLAGVICRAGYLPAALIRQVPDSKADHGTSFLKSGKCMTGAASRCTRCAQ